MKYLILLFSLSSSLSFAHYEKPELLALFFSTKNYNLDQETFCHLGTPIIFKGNRLINCLRGDNHDLVLWGKDSNMKVLYSTKNFLSVPHYLKNTLTWYEYDMEGVTLIHQWDKGELKKIPVSTHAKAVTFLGDKWIYQTKETLNVFEKGAFYPAQIKDVSYVFSPSVSTQGDFAVKVRRNSLDNSAPDEIWSFKNNKWTKVFSDKDSDPTSRWLSFNNSVTTGDGKVFVLARDGLGEAIVEISDKGERIIAREGLDVKKFESFTIAYNGGSLVFRAIDHFNRKVIHVYNENGLNRLLTQGDTVITENEVIGEINYPNEHSIIYNNPGVGEDGEVVIQATLIDFEDKKTLLGVGVLSIKKARP